MAMEAISSQASDQGFVLSSGLDLPLKALLNCYGQQ